MTTTELATAHPSTPDEVKRLEKAYELAKELLTFSENLIKTIDEKSRSSVATASAIAAFAFLVRKPDPASSAGAGVVSLWCMAALVGLVYVVHVMIVRPQRADTVDPAEMRRIEERSTLPEEMVYYNFAAFTHMYEANLSLVRTKSRYLTGQHVLLGLTLASTLWYLGQPGVGSPLSSSPGAISTPSTVPPLPPTTRTSRPIESASPSNVIGPLAPPSAPPMPRSPTP